jgi:Flp pilus assembly protein TadG
MSDRPGASARRICAAQLCLSEAWNDQGSRRPKRGQSRRAAIAVLSAILMVAMLAMVAFGVDVGYMMVVRTQLQTAADSAALASASIMGQGTADARTVAQK